MQKILVSACLLGEKVRYDGGDCHQPGVLEQWQQEGRVIALCPEVAGGLPVPRPAAEILRGDADGVLRGQQFVQRENGENVTDAFVDGAEKALALCIRHSIHIAVLKEGSPSCGVSRVNDGSFAKHKIAGMGVTATLLQRHGIAVFSEMQLSRVQQMLARLEPVS
ncbi:MAG: purine-nucleoside phosphorylase [Zetaproteobacteria bacterium CG1_02_53_45]|nr:MAG: purine-nucleoside phosphorylase [Zetaproteobacteria bacterium CG1_02_53_45]